MAMFNSKLLVYQRVSASNIPCTEDPQKRRDQRGGARRHPAHRAACGGLDGLRLGGAAAWWWDVLMSLGKAMVPAGKVTSLITIFNG